MTWKEGVQYFIMYLCHTTAELAGGPFAEIWASSAPALLDGAGPEPEPV